jgi:hypothetical protein
MPNALIGSLSLLDDLGEGLPLNNINYEWMIFQPLTLLWAEKIYVPRRFVQDPPRFEVDVGFAKSNEVLNRSLTNAWRTLVAEQVIVPVPITETLREAAVIAYYSVRNRLNQTALGELPQINITAKADLDPGSPPNQLQLDEQHFCINHLDMVAAHLVTSQQTDSVWITDAREEKAIRWLYCGELDPGLHRPRAAKSVINHLPLLRLPKCEFIPPVRGCANCGNNGATCYTADYGVENWIAGARRRLEQILTLRDSAEVKSLRRLLEAVSAEVAKSEIDAFRFDEVAAKSIRTAGKHAEKRIKKTINDITKYCELATLYSVPLALFGEVTGSTLLGKLSVGLAAGSTVISTACKHMLSERYSWLTIREHDL